MTKIMINENMREEVIDAIAEWMADNTDFSTDFLQSHGEDWLRAYSLDELYEDYYSGELEEVINAFMESGCACRDYYEYFVDDNGDLHDADDMGEVVSEMVYDDNKYAEWVLEEIEEGLITEPQGLIDIVSKYATASWEDVQMALDASFESCCKVYHGRIQYGGDFIPLCEDVVRIKRVYDLFKTTRFCGLDESQYDSMIETLNSTARDINWLADVAELAKRDAVAGVSIEKAVTLYMQDSWLK